MYRMKSSSGSNSSNIHENSFFLAAIFGDSAKRSGLKIM